MHAMHHTKMIRAVKTEEKKENRKDLQFNNLTDRKDMRWQDSQGLALVALDHVGRVQVADVDVRIDGDQDVRDVRLPPVTTHEGRRLS